MRFRVGLLLCLILAFIGSSCRKALEPTTDNNLAPETWITGAPQDSITVRSPQGVPIPPRITPIPVRYHLYWAGSDRDGAVSGFYWAVVETTAVPDEGQGLPQLPWPKPSNYHFTTHTDSTFVFRAHEDISEREHAFYVYSVDNKGKADATPARFVFRAYDRFPPLPIIDNVTAVGTAYTLMPGGGVTPATVTYTVTDSFDVTRPFPNDTVASGSQLAFRWHGEPTAPNTHVLGFRYKLDEANFNVADSSVKSASYNSGVGGDVLAPGIKRFTLRAVGESGWRGQTTRYFQMNFAPDSWFAGPNLADVAGGWSTYLDGNGKRYWYRNEVWTAFSGVTGSMLKARTPLTCCLPRGWNAGRSSRSTRTGCGPTRKGTPST